MKATSPLQKHSLWYKYKVPVWSNTNTPETQVIHNIMRVLRSIRNHGNLAYVSVPITSGINLYLLQKAHPKKSLPELLKEVIFENYNEGFFLSEQVMQRRQCPVLYPADLIPAHQKWEQAHFQALWLTIIAEKCTEMHMTPKWEFSNGTAEELTHVFQLKLGIPKHPHIPFFNTKEKEDEARRRMKNIQVFDHTGKLISINNSVELVEKAISWIKQEGFDPKRLEECLKIMKWTEERLKEGYYENN